MRSKYVVIGVQYLIDYHFSGVLYRRLSSLNDDTVQSTVEGLIAKIQNMNERVADNEKSLKVTGLDP